MSTVDCAVITNLGHALLGKVLAGKSGIHFTRASVGDGVISEGKRDVYKRQCSRSWARRPSKLPGSPRT